MTLSTISARLSWGSSFSSYGVSRGFSGSSLQRVDQPRVKGVDSFQTLLNAVKRRPLLPAPFLSQNLIRKTHSTSSLPQVFLPVNPGCSRIAIRFSYLNHLQVFPYSTQTGAKKLPIGIQSFQKLVQENYIYVDKTPLIQELIKEGSWYFLSRPRRFGKSLLLSTIKEIFKANKELFRNCALYSSSYAWKKYPVIHLDFSEMGTSQEELEKDLKERLIEIGRTYGKVIQPDSARKGLRDLVKALSEEGKVVVLIDEYDRPLVEHLGSLEKAHANRELLKGFFTMLKALDSDLQFVFLTGVSKFAQVSLFAEINNLRDITMTPKYARLLGYTEEEIRAFFKEEIARLAKAKKKTPDEIIELIRYWYEGYRFSLDDCKVYNPFSLLLTLANGYCKNYWFETSTPAFLIDQIKKDPDALQQLSGGEVMETAFSADHLDGMPIQILLWQTGYLTIHDYDAATRRYRLDYPNREIQESFLEKLAQGVLGSSKMQVDVLGCAQACTQALQERKLDLFFVHLRNLFAEIPYDLSASTDKPYRAILYAIGKLIGLEVLVKVKTHRGGVDMVIATKEVIYIMELITGSIARKALKQINDEKYLQKHLREGKEIILVRAHFDKKSAMFSTGE